MTDWSKIGKVVGKVAPILGAALPIPGGNVIGAILGAVFSGDPNDPEELARLIESDPDAAVKLKAIEAQHKERLEEIVMLGARYELEAEADKIASVNATMRVEAMAGDKWTRRWRPFWGYTSAVAFFMQVTAIAYLLVAQGAEAAALITALGSLSVFWGVPLAILGVAAYHRGIEKRVIAGETDPGIKGIIKSMKQ